MGNKKTRQKEKEQKEAEARKGFEDAMKKEGDKKDAAPGQAPQTAATGQPLPQYQHLV